MKELSLNVLDIAQNSIVAGATLVEISLIADMDRNRLQISIRDNGRGMTREQVDSAMSPFYTTRTTRRVGLGIPLFKMAAEQTGGELILNSTPGEGTYIEAGFGLDHIDRMPVGDMVSTVSGLVRMNPRIDFTYGEKVVSDFKITSFQFDTREIRQELEEVPLDHPDVSDWIQSSLREETNIIRERCKIL